MSNEVENLVKAKLKHRSGKIEEAIKIIAGSARSMGIEVKE